LIDEYAPQFSSNASDAVRVGRLVLLAEVISFFESRVPPPNFRLGLNKFSLDVPEERKQLLGTVVDELAASRRETLLPRFDPGRRLQEFENLPSEVDWEAAGAMTDVKDQGRCGCWCVPVSISASPNSQYGLFCKLL